MADDGIRDKAGKAGMKQSPEFEGSPQGGILELFLILAAERNLILVVTFMGGLVIGLLTFLITPRYTATATIMPPQQQSSTAASILGQLGPIAGISGADLGLRTPADLYLGLLGSQSISDRLIERFKLKELYKKPTQIEGRAALASKTHFLSGKDTLIKISVDDTDPTRAAAIANAYVEELHRQNTRLALSESSQRRLFFERRLDDEKSELNLAETAMKKLQENSGLLQVGAQVDATIRSIAVIQAEMASNESTLSMLKSGATDENPEVVRRAAELRSMNDHLRQLESSSKSAGRSGNPMLSVTSLPQAGQEYLEKLREVRYRESLFEALVKQYEIAKLDEIKESPVIQIVDRAQAPDKSSWPPRLELATLGAIFASILASTLAFMRHGIAQSSQREKQMELLKKLLLIRRAPNS